MVSIFLDKFNTQSYNNYINNLETFKIKCSCGVSGQCIKYGKYKRTVKYNDQIITFSIQRVYCKHCHTTHAILPTGIIPYQILSMKDTIEIIETYEDSGHSHFDDEANRIIDKYKIWKRRLNSLNISMKDGLSKIISFCASFFKMCFMQKSRPVYKHNITLFEVEYLLIHPPT